MPNILDYLKIKQGDLVKEVQLQVTPALIPHLLPTTRLSSACLLQQPKYFSQMMESHFPCTSGMVFFLLSKGGKLQNLWSYNVMVKAEKDKY